jgi:hypothetical protein
MKQGVCKILCRIRQQRQIDGTGTLASTARTGTYVQSGTRRITSYDLPKDSYQFFFILGKNPCVATAQ